MCPSRYTGARSSLSQAYPGTVSRAGGRHCRLMDISSGKVILNGEDITHETIRKRTEKGISYIPEDRQEFGLELDFSLRDNLALKSYYKEPFSSKGGVLRPDEFEKYGQRLIEEYDIRAVREPPHRCVP